MQIEQLLAGGAVTALVFFIVFFILLIFAAFYVYYSFAWMTIARKMKYDKPWIAWIPIIRIGMILSLGGFAFAWVLLVLIPIFGWIALFILGIITRWRIFEKRLYPGWFSLAVLIPQFGGMLKLVILGFVAWQDRKKRLTL